MSEEITIHDVVRNRYGAIARSVDNAVNASSCCGAEASASSCCTPGNLYNSEMLEGLPIDVTGLSLGCGGTQFAGSVTTCCGA